MAQRGETQVRNPVEGAELPGLLQVPGAGVGLAVFAHGTGSSRLSPRNNFVAERHRNRGLGTLLLDLLTEEEDVSRERRFDSALSTDRLVAATEWIRMRERTRGLNIGYFWSSTGAAAALRATGRIGTPIDAVVSRGGRVDMASEILAGVRTPTRFIVGAADRNVLNLNREAYVQLTCEKELRKSEENASRFSEGRMSNVVPGAGHLFEGERELEMVAEVAGDWFALHLD